MTIRFFDTLESTNNYCKLLDPDNVEEFTVICARRQTAGIGQRGNTWASEPYKNLTFSLILKPTFLRASEQYGLTMAVAVAVATSVERQLSRTVLVKWPNDIYVDDKKICGILSSSQIHADRIAHSICGIGLNVNQTIFPEWVPNPTSMKLLSGKEFVLEEVLASLLKDIQSEYNLLQKDPSAIKRQYMERLYRLGSQASYIYQGEHIQATIIDVDHFGNLVLKLVTGRDITCSLKEIRFV